MRLLPQTILRILLITIAILIVSGRNAEAEFQPLTRAPASEFVDTDRDKPHSVAIALAVPVVATAASAGLVVMGHSQDLDRVATVGYIGLALAPSLGHLYTGHWEGALIGTGLRVGGVGIAAMSIPVILGTYSVEAGMPFIIAGGITTIGATVYSIVDAPFSAKRANKKRQHLLDTLSVTPAPIMGPSQSTGWGAQLQTTF